MPPPIQSFNASTLGAFSESTVMARAGGDEEDIIFGLIRVEEPDDDFAIRDSNNPCSSGFQIFRDWGSLVADRTKIWNFHFGRDGITETLVIARIEQLSNLDFRKDANTCDRLTDVQSIQQRRRIFYSVDPFWTTNKATNYPTKTWTDNFSWVPTGTEPRAWPFTPADDNVVKMIMHQRQEDQTGDIGTTGSAFPVIEFDEVILFDWALFDADPQEEVTLTGDLLDLGIKDDSGSVTYPDKRVRHYWQRGTITVPP